MRHDKALYEYDQWKRRAERYTKTWQTLSQDQRDRVRKAVYSILRIERLETYTGHRSKCKLSAQFWIDEIEAEDHFLLHIFFKLNDLLHNVEDLIKKDLCSIDDIIDDLSGQVRHDD